MQTPWNKGWTLIQNFCIKHLITSGRVLHTIWTLAMFSALVCCEQNIWCTVQSTMLSPANYGSQSFVTLRNNHFDSTLSDIKYWLWRKRFWMLELGWCKNLVVFTKLLYLSINQVTCSFPIDKCCKPDMQLISMHMPKHNYCIKVTSRLDCLNVVFDHHFCIVLRRPNGPGLLWNCNTSIIAPTQTLFSTNLVLPLLLMYPETHDNVTMNL